VSTSVEPSLRKIGSGRIKPTLILGPGRSSKIPIGVFNFLETDRISSILEAWSACVSWAKFNRATFIPAMTRRRSISLDEVAGPIVQTIFVFVQSADISHTLMTAEVYSSNQYIEGGG
jgi:hypothetical protein